MQQGGKEGDISRVLRFIRSLLRFMSPILRPGRLVTVFTSYASVYKVKLFMHTVNIINSSEEKH